MGTTVCYFTGFYYHLQSVTSPHRHEYQYSLFESGTKTCVWTIALYRKDRTTGYIAKYKELDFSYNNNWCITGCISQ